MSALRGLPNSTPAKALLGALVVATMGAAVFVAWPRADPGPGPTAASVTPPHVPIVVSASHLSGGPVAAGVTTTLTAHALGTEPIGTLELWAGDERIAVRAAPSVSSSLHASWEWTPDHEGPTILFVRAIDGRGRVAQSNAVRVDVEAAAPESATLPGFALAVAPGPPELALAVPAVQLTLAECTAEVTVTGADPAAIGLALYDLLPSAPAFMSAATMAATESTAMTVPLTSGMHLLAASAFDDVAEVYSDPVLLDVPPGCGDGAWSGPVRLEGGNLMLPQAVDRAYAYLARDGGAAIRIPADPGTFIEPVGGVYVATPHLPPLDAESLTLEAWGWKGDELISLGTGSWVAPDGGAGGPPGGSFLTTPGNLGPHTSLYEVHDVNVGQGFCGDQFCFEEQLFTEITVERPPPGVFKPVNRTFRWQTPMPGVTDVVWQVFFHKPSATSDLDPPFLLDQGSVPLDDEDPGDFVIDLMPYLTGVVPITIGAGEQDLGPAEQLKTVLDPSQIGGEPTTDTTAVNLAWLLPGQIGYGSGGGTQATDVTFDVPAGAQLPGGLWVRVVPVAGSAVVDPSNTVHVSIAEFVPDAITPSGPDYSDRYELAMEHTPPVAPDRAFARCAVIVDVTDDYTPGQNIAWNLYVSQGFVCYTPPDDGWSIFDVFDAFVEFVSDAWDFVSTAWDDIKKTVVDFVLVAVPCDEFATAETCETIAGYALDAALMAVGVPPSIPDFDTTIGAFKGEIGQAMIELAGMEGACDAAAAAQSAPGGSDLPTCDDIIDAAMEEMIAQVEAQQHNAAENAIGKSVPDGIVIAPHPDGLWKPPSVTITATRISDEPIPVACYVGASMESMLTDHSWKEMIQVQEPPSVVWKWKEIDVEGDVSDFPLTGPGFTLPDLALNESHTQTVWLSDTAEWWESLGAKWWEIWQDGGNPYGYNPGVFTHTHLLLQAGAELTFEASSNCAQEVQQVETLTESGSNL